MTISLRVVLLAGASSLFTTCLALGQTRSEAGTSGTAVPAASGVAQQGAKPPAAASVAAARRPKAVEEVVVTAQRRAQRLERVPVSATVLSSATLAKAQITTESDLRTAAPGLTVRESRDSNEVNYAIRGQSLDALSDSRPGVLPYFNDVQFSGAGGSSAFYDLQSIQVLKGPQGTLFGRSSTGGAVLFTTQRPTNLYGGYLSQSLGDYGAAKTEGAVNLPIVDDKVLLRLAGFYEHRDGFQYNTFDQSTVGGFDRYDGRASLTLKPTDWITNDLVVDYSHFDGGSTQPVLYNFGLAYNPANPGNAIPGAPLPVATLFGPRGNPLFGQGVGLLPGQQNIVSQLVQQYKNGPYVVDFNGPNYSDPRSIELTNTTTFDVGPETQVKNILGYGHFQRNSGYDPDGTSLTIDSENERVAAAQISDEIQLLGKALNQNLSYVVGGFYSQESNHTVLNTNVTPTLGLPLQQNNYDKQDTTLALYAQGTYSLAELTGLKGLGFTLGARYTNEKDSNQILPGDISYTPANLANPLFGFYQSKISRNVGWTIGLQEQLDPTLLLYVVSRRSFRDAGYNGLNAPFIGLASENGGNGYGTETLTDGEIGTKFSGQVDSMPARLNIDAFIDDIKDAQHVAYTIGAGGAPAAITVNVPRTRTRGFEADGQIKPISWLTLGGSVNYLDSTFTGDIVRGVTFGPVPDSPRWSETAYGQVDFPISDEIDGFFGGNIYSQSSTYITSTGITNTGGRVFGYSVANFQIGVTDDRRGLSLTANLKNAFNRVYYVGGVAPAELFQFNSVVPGEPRTYLIEARVKF